MKPTAGSIGDQGENPQLFFRISTLSLGELRNEYNLFILFLFNIMLTPKQYKKLYRQLEISNDEVQEWKVYEWSFSWSIGEWKKLWCERITGDFSCHNNQLTSLKGCPSSVGGDFSCSGNKLTSLKGCPSSVGGDFYCSNNQLTNATKPQWVKWRFFS